MTCTTTGSRYTTGSISGVVTLPSTHDTSPLHPSADSDRFARPIIAAGLSLPPPHANPPATCQWLLHPFRHLHCPIRIHDPARDAQIAEAHLHLLFARPYDHLITQRYGRLEDDPAH